MISWLGTIFSGLSLFLQLKSQNKIAEQNDALIQIVVALFDKLKLSKDVHAAFQEIYFKSFEKYFNNFKSTDYNQNEEYWKTFYDLFLTTYKHYNLDIHIDELKDDPNIELKIDELYKQHPKTQSIINKRDLIVFTRSFTEMAKNVNDAYQSIGNYHQTYLKNSDLTQSKHPDMKRNMKDVMLDADRSMKSLINIQHQIIMSVQ